MSDFEDSTALIQEQEVKLFGKFRIFKIFKDFDQQLNCLILCLF